MRRLFFLVLVACNDPLTGERLTQVFESIVRDRASFEFPCDPDKIAIENLGGDAYRAVGCGFHATYECDADENAGNSKTDWRYRCVRSVRDDPTPDPKEAGD